MPGVKQKNAGSLAGHVKIVYRPWGAGTHIYRYRMSLTVQSKQSCLGTFISEIRATQTEPPMSYTVHVSRESFRDRGTPRRGCAHTRGHSGTHCVTRLTITAHSGGSRRRLAAASAPHSGTAHSHTRARRRPHTQPGAPGARFCYRVLSDS